jgi:two-component system response regulator RegX3
VYILQREGFDVLEAVDGPSALIQWQNNSPDLILLDLMLPGMSGVDVCREIRTKSTVPIIMVTAKDSEVDKVVGLEIGADDYVVKPYSTRELLARIKAVLRRGAFPDSNETRSVLEAGPVRLDTERHAVTVNGQPVTLPLKEFELLEYLMDNTNRVLTRGQIIDRVWGSNYYGDTKTLDVHIKRIRGKIEPDPANPKLIMTVRGLGYKFEV